MSCAVDSDCFLLGQCLPLGTKSVWSSFSPVGNKYVTVITFVC